MAKDKPDLAIAFGVGPHGDADAPDGYGADGEDEEYEACEEFFDHAGITLPKDKRKAACEALCNLIRIVVMNDESKGEEGEGEDEEEGPESGEGE